MNLKLRLYQEIGALTEAEAKEVLIVLAAPGARTARRFQRIYNASIGRAVGSLENAGLSSRTYNGLRRAGYETLEQAQSAADDTLLAIRHFGVKQLVEVRAAGPVVKQTEPLDDLVRDLLSRAEFGGNFQEELSALLLKIGGPQ